MPQDEFEVLIESNHSPGLGRSECVGALGKLPTLGDRGITIIEYALTYLHSERYRRYAAFEAKIAAPKMVKCAVHWLTAGYP